MNGDTKKKDLQPSEEEDDQASTPRAGSRRSSIAGLDSASEVFEDAYDDDDYFDDVPTFEEPQQSSHGAKSPMNVILPALQGLENEDDRDNEIESLGIAENQYHAISTPPSTSITSANVEHQSTATTDNDHVKQVSTQESVQPVKALGDDIVDSVKEENKEAVQPDKEDKKEAAQSVKEDNKEAVHSDKDISTQEPGHPVKEVSTQEPAYPVNQVSKESVQDVIRESDHPVKEASTQEPATPTQDTNDVTTTLTDKEPTHDDPKESWKSDTNVLSMDGFMQEVQQAELAFRDDRRKSTDAHYMSTNAVTKEEHVVEKSTVDVLQDLEDFDTNKDRSTSIELTPAPRDDTDSPVTENGLFDTKTSDEVSQPTRNTSMADDDDDKKENKHAEKEDHLGAIIPVMEDSAREIIGESSEMDRAAARSLEYEHPVEDPIDLDMFRDNVISIPTIDPKCVPINTLTPRDQEEAGMLLHMTCSLVMTNI